MNLVFLLLSIHKRQILLISVQPFYRILDFFSIDYLIFFQLPSYNSSRNKELTLQDILQHDKEKKTLDTTQQIIQNLFEDFSFFPYICYNFDYKLIANINIQLKKKKKCWNFKLIEEEEKKTKQWNDYKSSCLQQRAPVY